MNDTNMQKAFLLLNSNKNVPKDLLKKVKVKMNNYEKIPNQLESKQLFDYIKESKDYNIFEEYVNNEEHKALYEHYFHGIRHVDNVSIFSYYIAEKEAYTQKEIYLIMEAARYHDIGRTNDWEEGNHGYAGAKKYEEYRKEKMELQNIKIIKFLISSHDLPNTNEIKPLASQMFKDLNENSIEKLYNMANIIRDADALDRTRFNISEYDYLNPRYLKHDFAKEIIEVAQILNYRENESQD